MSSGVRPHSHFWTEKRFLTPPPLTLHCNRRRSLHNFTQETVDQSLIINIKMALQLGLRRGLLASNGVNSSLARSTISKSSFGGISQMRMKSTDAGDVIGIDLGTTNSCVAIMVRFKTDIM